MKTEIFAYSDKGCALAVQISKFFENSRCYAIDKFANRHDVIAVKSSTQKAREVFESADLMVFVGAMGIAVRAIAPCVKDKTTDPACVVIDDNANFVISMLSGHIGGANDFANLIAEKLGATAVITTATDVNGRFAVDSFAVKNNLQISCMKTAREFSAEILKRNLPFSLNKKFKCTFPECLYQSDEHGKSTAKSEKIGLYIGYEKKTPYLNTLRLIPKCLHIGIGCRRGTSEQAIKTLFDEVLEKYNFDEKAVKTFASIELKKDEQGLLDFCENRKIQPQFYTADELEKAQGDFTSSAFVQKTVGVGNVCERSAVLAASGGILLVHKTSKDGVTIAVAMEKGEFHFE